MQMTRTFPRASLFQQLIQDAPLMTATALLLGLSMLPTALSLGLDPRQFNGESIWIKPLKFEFSLMIYTLSLAYFARFVPASSRASSRWHWFERIVVACVFAEMIWIAGAAVLGTASHFNLNSATSAMLYRLMGAAAVTLTAASLVYGISIWRNRGTGLPRALHHSIALSLIATFFLTVVTAGTMAAGTGHLVGTPLDGARLPVMGWSREVGDLRVAHFFASHVMQIAPLATYLFILTLPRLALVGGYLALVSAIGLTIFAFVTGLQGHPFV